MTDGGRLGVVCRRCCAVRLQGELGDFSGPGEGYCERCAAALDGRLRRSAEHLAALLEAFEAAHGRVLCADERAAVTVTAGQLRALSVSARYVAAPTAAGEARR